MVFSFVALDGVLGRVPAGVVGHLGEPVAALGQGLLDLQHAAVHDAPQVDVENWKETGYLKCRSVINRCVTIESPIPSSCDI